MEAAADRFGALVLLPESDLRTQLDTGLALIAAAMQPDVDVELQIHRLDDLASGLPVEPHALVRSLFGPGGLQGNRDNYYDPQNSWLNCVLDRQRGIPITLTVILMEVGRRLGVSVEGVGMPGHFLAGLDEDTFVDPFGGGRTMDTAACERLFQQIAGRSIALPDGALGATPPRQILRRVLANLRAIGERSNDQIMNASIRLLALFPDASPVDLVALANHYAETGRFRNAADQLERAAPMVAASRREALEWQAQRWRARLN